MSDVGRGPTLREAFAQPAALTLLCFGFASGLPFLLVGGTLSAWLRESNVSLEGIGLMSLVGLSYSWKKVSVDTMVQEAVPDDFRGRTFALYDVAFNVGRVGGTVLAVWLIPTTGTYGALALIGAAMLGWIPLLTAWLRRPDAEGIWDRPA